MDDVTAALEPADQAIAGATDAVDARMPELSWRPALDPSAPFAMHSAEGRAVDVRVAGQDGPQPGSVPPIRIWPGMSC